MTLDEFVREVGPEPGAVLAIESRDAAAAAHAKAYKTSRGRPKSGYAVVKPSAPVLRNAPNGRKASA